jgi:hypothetical protein
MTFDVFGVFLSQICHFTGLSFSQGSPTYMIEISLPAFFAQLNSVQPQSHPF